jgi:hypothetical protein
MDKIKNYIIISLILLCLVGAGVFGWYLYIKVRNKPPQTIISTVTEIKYDTIRKTDSLWFPEPVYIEKPVYPINIDTPKVVEDYYSGKIYEYKYKDTNLSIKSNIIIHKNTLISLFQEYEIYRKTITTTNTIEVVKPPKFALSVGADVGAIMDSSRLRALFFVSASIQNGFNQYEVGYDPFNRAIKIGYKYTIIHH